MSGLFKRLSSRRSAGPEGSEPPSAAEQGTTDTPATTPAETGGHRSLLTDPAAPTRVIREGEQPEIREGEPPEATTRVLRDDEPDTPVPGPSAHTIYGTPASPVDPGVPAPFIGPVPAPAAPAAHAAPVEPIADLPAGLDPDELAATPLTSARRGKLRRRVAFLRAARELLLRDLGGFVYELHRTAHDIEHEAHRRLRETKLARLTRVDNELHELELRLDDVRRQVLVREPGVGGECPHCGELYGSAAHYCSNCGNPLTEAARRELAKAQAAPAAEPVVVPAPAPAEAAPAAPVDQPTQEIKPQDPEHPGAADFQWPRRESAATSAEASPETAESAADATRSAAAGTVGAAASGLDLRKTAPDAAADVGEPAPTGADDAPGEPTATTSGEDAAPLAPDAVSPGETPAEQTPDADPEPSDVVPADATPARDDVAGEPASPHGATSADEPSTAPEDSRELKPGDSLQARNGSAPDDSILRPVERRQ